MLRQTNKIASLIALCQRQHEAIGATLRSAEGIRFDWRVTSLMPSLFSTQATPSNYNLATTARSLEYPRFPAPAIAEEKPGVLRGAILWLGGYYSKESTLMRAAEGLYDSVTEAATDPKLFQTFEIPSDFQHEHAVLSLHVWLILVRLRPEGKYGKELAQIFYDNFQDDLEKRVRSAGVKVKVRGQLSELEKQFYGSCMAYDKALMGEGNESLAVALLRNVYQGAEEKESAAAKLEKYAQRELACLSQTDSAAVVAGNVRFSFAPAPES